MHITGEMEENMKLRKLPLLSVSPCKKPTVGETSYKKKKHHFDSLIDDLRHQNQGKQRRISISCWTIKL